MKVLTTTMYSDDHLHGWRSSLSMVEITSFMVGGRHFLLRDAIICNRVRAFAGGGLVVDETVEGLGQREV